MAGVGTAQRRRYQSESGRPLLDASYPSLRPLHPSRVVAGGDIRLLSGDKRFVGGLYPFFESHNLRPRSVRQTHQQDADVLGGLF